MFNVAASEPFAVNRSSLNGSLGLEVNNSQNRNNSLGMDKDMKTEEPPSKKQKKSLLTKLGKVLDVKNTKKVKGQPFCIIVFYFCTIYNVFLCIIPFYKVKHGFLLLFSCREETCTESHRGKWQYGKMRILWKRS